MSTIERIRTITILIRHLQQAMNGAYEVLLGDDNEAMFRIRQTASKGLLAYLAYNDMLVGAEHCDECAEVKGTVTRIEQDTIIIYNTGTRDRFIYSDEIA